MAALQLTGEQQRAVERFDDLLDGSRRRLTLGGLAGTGKTTVIKALVERYGRDNEIVVCTPTGKAAHVLRSKGVGAVTMHSLIYKPRIIRGQLDFVPRNIEGYDLAIVDESSMLSQRLVTDFEARVRAIFYVGDHGQLEPVGDDPGLMRAPNLRLKQIHRQAAGSPIIRFAHGARKGLRPRSTAEAVVQDALVLADMAEAQGLIAVLSDAARHEVEQALLALHAGDVSGVSVLQQHLEIDAASAHHVVVQNGGSADLSDFDVVLCGFNKTRVKVNAWIRKKRGYKGALPSIGETVICLRNDRDYQVWNGMMGVVTAIDTKRNRLSVETDDGPRHDLPFKAKQFGAEKTIMEDTASKRRGYTLWDFGYCLTVHKSQGSEWPRVAVKEEIASAWSSERWRYTAATRASKELRWIL